MCFPHSVNLAIARAYIVRSREWGSRKGSTPNGRSARPPIGKCPSPAGFATHAPLPRLSLVSVPVAQTSRRKRHEAQGSHTIDSRVDRQYRVLRTDRRSRHSIFAVLLELRTLAPAASDEGPSDRQLLSCGQLADCRISASGTWWRSRRRTGLRGRSPSPAPSWRETSTYRASCGRGTIPERPRRGRGRVRPGPGLRERPEKAAGAFDHEAAPMGDQARRKPGP